MMKICTKCDFPQPFSEFFADRQKKDGLSSACRHCRRRWREANREKIKAYDAVRCKTEKAKMLTKQYRQSEEGRRRKAVWMRNNREMRPMKNKARKMALYAEKIGLVRRSPCAVCGDPVVEGHHSDYSKPFDLQWLCKKHHFEEHARLESLGIVLEEPKELPPWPTASGRKPRGS